MDDEIPARDFEKEHEAEYGSCTMQLKEAAFLTFTHHLFRRIYLSTLVNPLHLLERRCRLDSRSLYHTGFELIIGYLDTFVY